MKESTKLQPNHIPKTEGFFVEPTEYVTGHQETFLKDKKSSMRKPVTKAAIGQYISIMAMITAWNNHTDIVRQALQGFSINVNLRKPSNT